jgi:hypothetical protein
MTDGERESHGTIANISSRLITALPANLLIVLLLNLCFIGMLAWLSIAQNASRERILAPLLDACSKTIPLEGMKYFAPQKEPHP